VEIDLAALGRDIDNHQRPVGPSLEDAFVNGTAPTAGPLDLRWRLFGIHFRVQPSFWLINLLFGYMYVQGLRGADLHLFAYLGIWLLCAFVSILIHELGHVTAGRIFGQRSDITLHSMGGVAIGHFDRLKRWQRIVVSAAGPVAGLSLFAFAEWVLPRIADAIDPKIRTDPDGWAVWYRAIVNPSHVFEEGEFGARGLPGMLVIMNLIWNLFNLLPIIPLDGGQIMREVITGIFPRQGLRLSFGISFLLAGSIAFYAVLGLMRPGTWKLPLDPLFTALMFGMIAFSSFSAMQAVGAEEPPPKRWRDYEERDW
jgi:Zn-dependent protease